MAIKDVILGYAKGDKGDRGPQGEKGATGATGPKGEPGNIADAQITDTEGLDVAKGQKTTAQKLFDAIANRIVTKLVTNDALTKKLADYMLKGMMSNTNVNNTGTVPTSALMYSMFEQINSDFKARDASLEIGQVERGAYIYLRNKVTNNLLMLRLNEDDKKLAFNSEVDGQWGTETELVTKSDLDLQTQKLHKNVVIYRIGNIAMLSISSWVRKEELAGVTIPTGYRPVKNISIPFTQQNFNDGSYCDVTMEGKINYTGTSPILVNEVWFCA